MRKGDVIMVELKGDHAMVMVMVLWVGGWRVALEPPSRTRSMSLFLAGKIEKDPLHFEFWRALLLSPFSMC